MSSLPALAGSWEKAEKLTAREDQYMAVLPLAGYNIYDLPGIGLR